MGSSFVADLDESVSVSSHEWHSHSNLRSVRENCIFIALLHFNSRENVIPSSSIKTDNVFSQFIEIFLHFKATSESLNQDSASNSSNWDIEVFLSLKNKMKNIEKMIEIFHPKNK